MMALSDADLIQRSIMRSMRSEVDAYMPQFRCTRVRMNERGNANPSGGYGFTIDYNKPIEFQHIEQATPFAEISCHHRPDDVEPFVLRFMLGETMRGVKRMDITDPGENLLLPTRFREMLASAGKTLRLACELYRASKYNWEIAYRGCLLTGINSEMRRGVRNFFEDQTPEVILFRATNESGVYPYGPVILGFRRIAPRTTYGFAHREEWGIYAALGNYHITMNTGTFLGNLSFMPGNQTQFSINKSRCVNSDDMPTIVWKGTHGKRSLRELKKVMAVFGAIICKPY